MDQYNYTLPLRIHLGNKQEVSLVATFKRIHVQHRS